MFFLALVFSYGPSYPTNSYCRSQRLSPQEIQMLWDNYLRPGFTPTKIIAGTPEDLKVEEKTVKKKKPNKAGITSWFEDKALVAEMETDKQIPYTSGIFNKSIKGDFAYGIFLSDSLRIGRCGEGTIGCSVDKNGLLFKNVDSALGIYWKGLKSLVGLGEKVSQPDSYAAGDVKVDKLQEAMIITSPMEDTNDLQLKKVSHVPQTTPMNSFLVDDLSAEFIMQCSAQDSTDRCRVLLFSFFDKYYNAYYSGNLLAVVGGPVMWGATKKMFSKVASMKYGGKAATAIKKATEPMKKAFKNAWLKITEKDFKYYAANTQGKVMAALQHGGIGDGLEVIGKNIYSIESQTTVAALQKEVIPKLATPQAKQAMGAVVESRAAAAHYGKSLLESLEKAAPEEKLATAIAAADHAPQLIGAKFTDDFLNANFAGWVVESGHGSVTALKPVTDFDVVGNFLKGKVHPDKLYRIAPGEVVDTVALSDIKNFLKGQGGSQFIVEIKGNPVVLNSANAESVIKAAKAEGLENLALKAGDKVKVDFAQFGGYENFRKNFANQFYDYTKFKYGCASKNYDAIIGALQSAKAMPTRSANALTFMMKLAEGKGSKVGGALMALWKFEAAPAIFWLAKSTEGSPIKAYMTRPQDITNIKMGTGTDTFYNSAYLDVFVKEGSDNGDLFNKALKYLMYPITYVLTEVDFLKSTGKWIESKFGHQYRDAPENVILYNEVKKCPECKINLSKGRNVQVLETGTISPLPEVNPVTVKKDQVYINSESLQGTKSYFVEYPDPESFEESGFTLGVFTHRLNLTTKEGEINIASSLAAKEDCVTKAKNLKILGIDVGGIFASDIDAAKVALPIGIVENTLGLVMPGIPGLAAYTIGSMVIQDDINDQLSDCVDTVDGYYITYSLIPLKPEDKSDSFIGKLKKAVSKSEEETKKSLFAGTPLGKIGDAIKEQFNNIIQSKTYETIQLNVDTKGKTNQSVFADDIFLFWEGGNARQMPNKYDTESVQTLMDEHGNKMVVDKRDGTIDINGKKIVNPDIVRLVVRDNQGPFMALPVVVTIIPAVSAGDMFEVHTNGDFIVIDLAMLDCIRSGVFEQTGLNMYGNSLYEYMGPAEEVWLESGIVIRPGLYGGSSYFLVEGGTIGRSMEYNTRLVVNKTRNAVITGVQGTKIYDRVVGIEFNRGTIVYKPETNEFIMWIKIMAEMDGRYIASMIPQHTTVMNPETNCEEDAFNLKLNPLPGDVTAQEEVTKMNIALEKAGPFQYFQTPDYMIMFYSKLEDGVCKRYMRVVDKKTGRVISDSEITGITQTPNGYRITTADGKTHDLGFEVDNGRPVLSYNGDRQPLLLAQGRNGAFFYDPNTGKWYVDNAQLLPIDDRFKTDGAITTGNLTQYGKNPLESVAAASRISKSKWDIPLTNDYLLYGLVMLIGGMFAYLYIKK